MAWGLNHVTTQAEVITFQIGRFTLVLVSMVALERRSPMPIQMTIRLPTAKITFCSHGSACIRAPTPKKQARPRVMSKKMTMRAVRNTRLRFWVSAVLMTKRFCNPMGAT